MSIPKQQRMMMVLSVIMRGKGKQYREMLESRGIHFHLQTVGFGTAPSEMMDIFGLGSNDKDIVISLAPHALVGTLTTELAKSLDTAPRYGGLMPRKYLATWCLSDLMSLFLPMERLNL